MLAFIENKNLSHLLLSNEIKKKLQTVTNIDTIKNLSPAKFHSDYDGTSSSMHRKKFNKKVSFSIFDLLFDHSKYVTN